MKCNGKQIVSVLVASTFLWTSVGWTPAVYAQSAPAAKGGRLVKPSAAQLELNDAGVQAIIDKDYDLAVQIFNSSLALGAINITYLNRGRAYQHAGQCELAEESYLAAYSAPAMAEPSAASVAATLDRYRKELQDTCMGKVLLKCDPAEIRVSINGRNIGQCPSTALELKAGEYRIRGTLMGRSVESVVDISAMKVRELSLRLDLQNGGQPAQHEAVGSGVQPVQGSEFAEEIRPLPYDDALTLEPTSKGRAMLLLGTGIALLTAGVVMANSGSEGTGYFEQTVVPVYLYSSGALFSIYGLVRFID